MSKYDHDYDKGRRGEHYSPGMDHKAWSDGQHARNSGGNWKVPDFRLPKKNYEPWPARKVKQTRPAKEAGGLAKLTAFLGLLAGLGLAIAFAASPGAIFMAAIGGTIIGACVPAIVAFVFGAVRVALKIAFVSALVIGAVFIVMRLFGIR